MAFKMNGWSAFTKKTDGKGDKDKPVLKEGPGRVKEKILKKHKKEEKTSMGKSSRPVPSWKKELKQRTVNTRINPK